MPESEYEDYESIGELTRAFDNLAWQIGSAFLPAMDAFVDALFGLWLRARFWQGVLLLLSLLIGTLMLSWVSLHR
jgi:hypothetical protein